MSYFIDGQVFRLIYTFYVVFDDLFLNWFCTHINTQKSKASIWEKLLHHCQRALIWWTLCVISIITENKLTSIVSLTIKVLYIKILFFQPLKYSHVAKLSMHWTHCQLMSLGTCALKVSGEGPEVIQAPQGGLHGNPASGNHPSSSR